MSAALTKSPAQSMEIALVLQGGGALGAYEYGGIAGALRRDGRGGRHGPERHAASAVTGVSIGAINAACVVGARDRGRCAQAPRARCGTIS